MIKTSMRTHMCGDLRAGDIGSQVRLAGWVRRVRDHGQLVFIDLRDRSGITQLVAGAGGVPGLMSAAAGLRSETVIGIFGVVRERRPGAVNPDLPTGQVEVAVTELEIMNEAGSLPFLVDEAATVDEALRLKYRYLDLRGPRLQSNLRLRHEVTMAIRDFCSQEGFWEIETPYMTRSTPEGARDYLVPSRVRQGRFYALPQSPQIYKQLLMVSGIDRYFQMARCFRDEDLRANRQPEFTQVDIEMSFAGSEDVMELTERLVSFVYEKAMGRTPRTPFQRLTYDQAVNRYGTDKPDPGLGPELVDLGPLVKDSPFRVFSSTLKDGGQVKGLKASGLGNYSRRELDDLEQAAKKAGAGGLIWFRPRARDDVQSPVRKHLSTSEIEGILSALDVSSGDLGLVVAGPGHVASSALGALRTMLGRRHGWKAQGGDEFLWVTDFPLLEENDEPGRLVARHHPFTAPAARDLDLLESDPLRARAQAYDLVLNGEELAGGSVRNNVASVQRQVFQAMGIQAGEVEDKFGFLLKALESGAPPHAGIAMGLERLIMEMSGASSIRDVIAFPKTSTATCAVTGAPAAIDERQLSELGLSINAKKADHSSGPK